MKRHYHRHFEVFLFLYASQLRELGYVHVWRGTLITCVEQGWAQGGCSLKLTDYCRAEVRCYLSDRANTEAETMRQSRGGGSNVETEARPCEAEARPSQLKNCLEAASSRGRCLEDYIPGVEWDFSTPFPSSLASVKLDNSESPRKMAVKMWKERETDR